MEEACPSRGRSEDNIKYLHCFHEKKRETYSTGWEIDVTKELECCWCGSRKIEKWKTQPDPKHGPYAPKILTKVE